ncbi:MAG: GAF domain-containing protein [Anaerolineales bacterium]|nr:GAF domain-containing protein [Anaerolineales bacterium]
MSRLGTTLTWRFVFWLALLALIPLAVVYSYMQGPVREAFADDQLRILATQARAYSIRLEAASAKEAQSVTDSVADITPNTTFFLLDLTGKYVAHSDNIKKGSYSNSDLGFSLTSFLLTRESAEFFDEKSDTLFASYRKTIIDPVAVVAIRLDKTQSPINNLTKQLLQRLLFSLLVIAVISGVLMFIQLTPAYRLAEFANRLGQKNFSESLNLSTFRGEHRAVAQSLNQLSSSIQTMLTELEQSVIERTHELETRATQLRAAADVGKAATSVRNLAELLQQTANLISARFGFYHVGIFLLDERKEYAVLRAANSAGGKDMLERNHKLKVDEKSIVGYATQNILARIALDVGQDAVFFDNPDLPNTRSEMALPLVASGQVLGALDVQSVESNAFTQSDIATLQILADQIAIAIQNANLFAETERALQTSREVYGEISRNAWRKVLHNQPRVGYLATLPGATQTNANTLEPSLARVFETGQSIISTDGLTLTVPIKVRGQTIGGIRLRKSDISDSWSQEEANLALTLSDQLSGALESARLYQESQQRAARESLVSDISARLSSVSHIDTILRETVQELGQTFGNARVSFQMAEQPNGHGPAKGPENGAEKESDE